MKLIFDDDEKKWFREFVKAFGVFMTIIWAIGLGGGLVSGHYNYYLIGTGGSFVIGSYVFVKFTKPDGDSVKK